MPLLRWRVRGAIDFLSGKPIDAFYRYRDHLREIDRATYEAGWRVAKAHAWAEGGKARCVEHS